MTLGFLGPALVLYSAVVVYPLSSAVPNSLFDWNDTVADRFVGLDNYRQLFTTYPLSDQLAGAIVHNCAIFAGTMLLQNTVGLAIAVVLHGRRTGRRLFQVLYTLPYLMNPLVVGYLWTVLLNPAYGPLAALFDEFGPQALVRPWLDDPATALPTVIAVSAWQWIGFPILLFGAGLAGIPPQYAEAARLDGASSWAVFRWIQLPLLTPAIGAVTVLSVIASFTTFGLVYAFGGSNGGPGGATDVLGLIFYRTGFDGGTNSVGLSSALAVLIFAAVFAIAVTVERIIRRREVSI